MNVSIEPPGFFLSAPHTCSYLTDRQAMSLFVDPQHRVEGDSYGFLLEHGFRRSGRMIYRPHCIQCRACVPVRVPVARFRQSRSQRRVWLKNRDIRVKTAPAEFNPAHFELYTRYQSARHKGGPMEDMDSEDYLGFLTSPHIDTAFYELTLGGHLAGVAVADAVPRSLSAVYTFFDPDLSGRSLGTFAILWEIEHALGKGLEWLYLGYWIHGCGKMSYKSAFHPMEGFNGRQWLPLNIAAKHLDPQKADK